MDRWIDDGGGEKRSKRKVHRVGKLKPEPGAELTQISENRRANDDYALTLQIVCRYSHKIPGRFTARFRMHS